VVFIHGLWLLPSCWERWAKVFEDAGYAALTLSWPVEVLELLGESARAGNVSAMRELRAYHHERRGGRTATSVIDELATRRIRGTGIVPGDQPLTPRVTQWKEQRFSRTVVVGDRRAGGAAPVVPVAGEDRRDLLGAKWAALAIAVMQPGCPVGNREFCRLRRVFTSAQGFLPLLCVPRGLRVAGAQSS